MRDFYARHKRAITVTACVAVFVLFAASVILAIFIGGEFSSTDDGVKVAGIMRFNTRAYSTAYFDGDKFSFNTAESSLYCIYQDPETKQVQTLDELAPADYGFRVNGKGKIYNDPGDIKMTKDVEFVSVVYKKYPSLHLDIPTHVYKGYDSAALVADFVMEAENADVYKSNVRLTDEAKRPFTTFGDTKATLCSGGHALRNFQANDMRVEFIFACSEETDAELTVMVCKRPGDRKALEEYYDFTINGSDNGLISGTRIPAAKSGYFEPFEITEFVHLQKGVNIITFSSGTSIGKTNPVNLDGIRVLADKPIICGVDALTEF